MDSFRRTLLRTGALAFTPLLASLSWPVLAHHGWNMFNQDDPIYLEGVARVVKWRNPHAELALDLAHPLRLPQDLATRAIPAQSSSVNVGALLARARLPSGTASLWEIELAPLLRMSQWRVPEVRVGQSLAVLGFALHDLAQSRDTSASAGGGLPGNASPAKDAPLMRAELLFLEGRSYPLRSGPA
jgi:hypothetical protein